MISTYELQIAINGLLKSDSSRIWPVARSRLRCGARSKPRLIVSERIAKLSSCCAVFGASRLMAISLIARTRGPDYVFRLLIERHCSRRPAAGVLLLRQRV